MIDDHRLSPHQFGIPQVRDRVYIVGCRSGLDHFDWPNADAQGRNVIFSATRQQSARCPKAPASGRRLPQRLATFIELYPKNT